MAFYMLEEMVQDIVDGIGVTANSSGLTITLFIDK
jgi:hypothetical protein